MKCVKNTNVQGFNDSLNFFSEQEGSYSLGQYILLFSRNNGSLILILEVEAAILFIA